MAIFAHRKSVVLCLSFAASMFLVLTVPSSIASATQRNVPSSYGSIQSAINASSSGDEIVVNPGVYRENIEINNKYISLRSTGDVDNTVIAGNAGRSPVIIRNVPFRNGYKTLFSGFKITSGNSPAGHGGGITIYDHADPIIDNNKIENNYANTGGGILIYDNSNPLIKNNIVRNNTAYSFGGGVFAVRSSSPTIINNQITGNTTVGDTIQGGGPSGGGIYLENENSNESLKSQPTVVNNVISNNSADFAGGAIAVMVGVNANIEGNTIESNTAPYGGGIHLETHGSSPRIVNNSLNSNISPNRPNYSGSGHGGGIAVYASSKPYITDNSINLNRSSAGGAGIVVAEGSNADIERNSLNSNSAVDSGAEGGGIYVGHASASISNNVMNGNDSHLGGGIALLNASSTSIVNNTFVNNKVRQSIGGGGLFISNDPSTQSSVINNIFSSNEKYQIFEDSVKMNFENNFIQNSGLGLYYSYAAHGITNANTLNNSVNVNANNTIDGNPGFNNSAGGDFTLSQSSVARGSGKTTSIKDDRDLFARTTNDVGAYSYHDSNSIKKQPVYRFWSDTFHGHFYTISSAERNSILLAHQPSVWKYENTAYYAFSEQLPGTVPLYRFWSNKFSGHFYTTDSSERDYIIASYPTDTWNYEGIAYFVYPLNYQGLITTKPAYRFWSNTYKHHFYTTDESEKDYVQNSLSDVWSFEGNRFLVPY